jgi:hypothetical protein
MRLKKFCTDSDYKKSIAQVAGKVKSFPINYGLAEKVGAKHWDRKSTVSAIGYCPTASPWQDAIADQDVVSHTAQKTGFSEKPVFYWCKRQI